MCYVCDQPTVTAVPCYDMRSCNIQNGNSGAVQQLDTGRCLRHGHNSYTSVTRQALLETHDDLRSCLPMLVLLLVRPGLFLSPSTRASKRARSERSCFPLPP